MESSFREKKWTKNKLCMKKKVFSNNKETTCIP